MLALVLTEPAAAHSNACGDGTEPKSVVTDPSNIALPTPPVIDVNRIEPAVGKAIGTARDALDRAPRSAAAWGRYGMVLRAHELVAESQICFTAAERLDPRNVRWPYYQGISLAGDDPAKAVSKLSRAVELAAADTDAPRARLAEVLLALGRWDEAERHFRVLARGPDSARASLGLARLAAERGQWEECLRAAEAAAAHRSARKAANLLMSDAHRRQGRRDLAARFAAKAAGLPNDLAWPDALRDEFVQFRTGSQGLIDEANQLLDRGNSSAAKTLLVQAVKDYPQSDQLWMLLGTAHLRGRDPAGAVEPLRKSVELKSDSVVNRYHLGVALFTLRRHREAAQSLREAIRLKPDAQAYALLAACDQREGNQAAAIDALRESVRLAPHDAKTQFNLGALMAQQRKFSQAIEHFERAVELNPDDQRAAKFLQEARRRLDGEP
jgi:tetratricopeptide (TPR) repeat protein